MSTSEYIIEMNNITKTFLNGAIIANDNITLKVKKGEIHALIGENGAGKSTLMSILFGLYDPTSGEILINGKPTLISNPIKASKLGIGMVHQHFKLVDTFSVLQNIILGIEPTIGGQLINFKKAERKIRKISSEYNLNVNPHEIISNLTVGAQQRVEILKTLYRRSEIIVFDEPTAVLTPQEIDGLLKIIKDLKNAGKTIIFISHKLGEVKAVADRATVIRQGKVIETFNVADKNEEQMAVLMVGRELVEIKNEGKVEFGKPLLSIVNLNVSSKVKHDHVVLKNFNLDVKAGEIVAIAGVEGNGQQELVNAITGLTKIKSGKILFKEIDVTHMSISKKYKLGMSHIVEDRHKFGLVLDFSILNNMVLQNVNAIPFSRYGFINQKAIQKYGQDIINNYDVRGSRSGFAAARGLSGGNQQKAIIGRELTREHKILVVVQPTRGLDVGAIEYIHTKIIEEKSKGNAILLVSYELSEVMALADRIVVLYNGEIAGEVLAKDAVREEIGLMMGGRKNGDLDNAKYL